MDESTLVFSSEVSVYHDSKKLSCILVGIGKQFAVIYQESKVLLYEPFQTDDLAAFLMSPELT